MMPPWDGSEVSPGQEEGMNGVMMVWWSCYNVTPPDQNNEYRDERLQPSQTLLLVVDRSGRTSHWRGWVCPGGCCLALLTRAHYASQPRLLIAPAPQLSPPTPGRTTGTSSRRGRNNNDLVAWNHEIDWKLTAGFMNIFRDELIGCGLTGIVCQLEIWTVSDV